VLKSRSRTKTPPCFECGGTGLCDCIVCVVGKIGPGGYAIMRPGPCVVCAARAWRERNAKALEPFDPRDRSLWEHHAASDGNKQYNVFKPAKGLK
jgi:hypothetical protein